MVEYTVETRVTKNEALHIVGSLYQWILDISNKAGNERDEMVERMRTAENHAFDVINDQPLSQATHTPGSRFTALDSVFYTLRGAAYPGRDYPPALAEPPLYYTTTDMPCPATHWFYRTHDAWVAIADENEDEWFEEADENRLWTPRPRVLPITDLPSFGLLYYRLGPLASLGLVQQPFDLAMTEKTKEAETVVSMEQKNKPVYYPIKIGESKPATHWFYSESAGYENRETWVAVCNEDEDKWFETFDQKRQWTPRRRVLPIDELPSSGRIWYRDEAGQIHRKNIPLETDQEYVVTWNTYIQGQGPEDAAQQALQEMRATAPERKGRVLMVSESTNSPARWRVELGADGTVEAVTDLEAEHPSCSG